MSKYLKLRMPYILWWAFSELLAGAIFALYRLPIMPFLHGSGILLLSGLIVGGFDLVRIKKKDRLIREARFELLTATNHIEQDYLDAIGKLERENRDSNNKALSDYNNMIEYYTVWAHQIKTPLSGLSLIIQNIDDDELRQQLQSELVRTEEYVDMVLGFMRLQSESNDFLFEKTSLRDIASQEIRRLRPLFFNKKIHVAIEGDDNYAVTDKRWFGFCIGQLLANSIKYSNGGTITITIMEKAVSVRDEGIGIAPEDLPRIFEKGYTGYNGRSDKKSTGIGLYLVKQAMKSIGGDVAITSEPNKGTEAILTIM